MTLNIKGFRKSGRFQRGSRIASCHPCGSAICEVQTGRKVESRFPEDLTRSAVGIPRAKVMNTMEHIVTSADAAHRKPTHEEIAAAAFHLFLENGCQDGHDLEDWFWAETLLTLKLEEVAQTQPSFQPPQPVRDASKLESYELEPLVTPAGPGFANRGETRRKSSPFQKPSKQSRARLELVAANLQPA